MKLCDRDVARCLLLQVLHPVLVQPHTQDLKLVLLQPDPTSMPQGVRNEDPVMMEEEDPFMIHKDLVMKDKEDQVTMCLGYLLTMHLEELAMMLNLEVLPDMLHLETRLLIGLQHRLVVVVGTKHHLEEETLVGDELKVLLENTIYYSTVVICCAIPSNLQTLFFFFG